MALALRRLGAIGLFVGLMLGASVSTGHTAKDVALTTSFGDSKLESFKVWTDELVKTAGSATSGRSDRD